MSASEWLAAVIAGVTLKFLRWYFTDREVRVVDSRPYANSLIHHERIATVVLQNNSLYAVFLRHTEDGYRKMHIEREMVRLTDIHYDTLWRSFVWVRS